MWQKAQRVVLEDIMDIPEPHYEEVGGMKVAYRVYGHGKQVLCLPPWPASSIAYLPLGLALREHLQLIAVDLPGWGGHSDNMIWEPTMVNYARVLEELMSKIGIKDPDLMGYSYGGALAQQMIALHKISPKKLALVSTIHSGDEIMQTAKNWLKVYSVVQSSKAGPILAKKVLVNMMSRNIDKGPYHLMRHYYICQITEKEYLMGDFRSIVGSMIDLTEKEFINYFKRTTETLIVYADGDMPFIRSETQEIAKKMNLEPVVVENASHDHLFFDANKAADILLNFFLD